MKFEFDREFIEPYPGELNTKYDLRMFEKYFNETEHGQSTALYGRGSTIVSQQSTVFY